MPSEQYGREVYSISTLSDTRVDVFQVIVKDKDRGRRHIPPYQICVRCICGERTSSSKFCKPNCEKRQIAIKVVYAKYVTYSNEDREYIRFCIEKLRREIIEQTEKIIERMDRFAERMENRIGRFAERMENRMDRLAERMENRMDRFAERMENRMDRLAERMDRFAERMEKKMDELGEQIDGLGNRMVNLENTIRGLGCLYRRNQLQDSSYKSAGIIKVSQSVNELTQYASGNLVLINSRYYFSTCRHVILTDDCQIRDIEFIQLLNNVTLEIEGPIYIFRNTSIYYDYALIEVKYDPSLEGCAVRISNEPAILSESLRCICFRGSTLVYAEGRIVEIDLLAHNSYQTDYMGPNILSGSGYFDEYGNLKAIHLESGDFVREDSKSIYYQQEYYHKSNAPLITSIQNSIEVCNKTNREELRCYKTISNALTLQIRNPRKMVLGANKLLELSMKNFDEIIIVEQKMQLYSVDNKLNKQ